MSNNAQKSTEVLVVFDILENSFIRGNYLSSLIATK